MAELPKVYGGSVFTGYYELPPREGGARLAAEFWIRYGIEAVEVDDIEDLPDYMGPIDGHFC